MHRRALREFQQLLAGHTKSGIAGASRIASVSKPCAPSIPVHESNGSSFSLGTTSATYTSVRTNEHCTIQLTLPTITAITVVFQNDAVTIYRVNQDGLSHLHQYEMDGITRLIYIEAAENIGS
jgi:hypothetical protein